MLKGAKGAVLTSGGVSRSVLIACEAGVLTGYHVHVDIGTEYEAFMRRYAVAPAEDLEILREGGRDLARRLRSAAVDLSSSKATEFSPLIEEYILMAAKVAMLAYGAGAPGLEPYERDVYYYGNFDPPGYIVGEYERFKRERQDT